MWTSVRPWFACAWSPDCTQIATASRDSTARIWNVATQREVAKLEAGAYTHPLVWLYVSTFWDSLGYVGSPMVKSSQDERTGARV